MDPREDTINRVLVHLFNDLLRIEENTLRKAGITALSLREIHTLEAVCGAAEGENTMTALASRLRVTVGSLTVAVGTLERKGYVTRLRSQVDRRRIHVSPTERALAVEQIHRDYHRKMTQAAMDAVPPDQLDVFIAALEAVSRYFYDQDKEEQA